MLERSGVYVTAFASAETGDAALFELVNQHPVNISSTEGPAAACNLPELLVGTPSEDFTLTEASEAVVLLMMSERAYTEGSVVTLAQGEST